MFDCVGKCIKQWKKIGWWIKREKYMHDFIKIIDENMQKKKISNIVEEKENRKNEDNKKFEKK